MRPGDPDVDEHGPYLFPDSPDTLGYRWCSSTDLIDLGPAPPDSGGFGSRGSPSVTRLTVRSTGGEGYPLGVPLGLGLHTPRVDGVSRVVTGPVVSRLHLHEGLPLSLDDSPQKRPSIPHGPLLDP